MNVDLNKRLVTVIHTNGKINYFYVNIELVLLFTKSNMIDLLSGCDSGFGLELAKHLARLGFKVYAGCLRKKQGGPGVKELVSL